MFYGERILHMCSMVIEDLTYMSMVRGSYICALCYKRIIHMCSMVR